MPDGSAFQAARDMREHNSCLPGVLLDVLEGITVSLAGMTFSTV